jgi:hypothetical protein
MRGWSRDLWSVTSLSENKVIGSNTDDIIQREYPKLNNLKVYPRLSSLSELTLLIVNNLSELTLLIVNSLSELTLLIVNA